MPYIGKRYNGHLRRRLTGKIHRTGQELLGLLIAHSIFIGHRYEVLTTFPETSQAVSVVDPFYWTDALVLQ
jgi:hypothetical protein